MKRKLLAYSCMITVMMFCAGTAFGDVLLGTTGTGKEGASTLYEVDQTTGAMTLIGDVGYLVSGMDYFNGTLYGVTSAKDPSFHGLIMIDPTTGKGTPVGTGWLPGSFDKTVAEMAIDSLGNAYGWNVSWGAYDKDKADDLIPIMLGSGTLGVSPGDAGLKTATFGLAFDLYDNLHLINGGGGNVYNINTSTGESMFLYQGEYWLAHHGDVDPITGVYWGLGNKGEDHTDLLPIDLSTQEVLPSVRTEKILHTLAFGPYNMDVDIDKAKIDFKDKPSSDKYDVKGEITLREASDGIYPPDEIVTVRVGTSSVTIPPGSFKEEKGPEYKCHCVIDGVKVNMKIKNVDSVVYKFDVKADGVDLSDTANPVDILLVIDNDRGASTLKLKGKLDYKRHKAHDKEDG